ncbi:hypothetical protein A4X03_0g7460, partial [Tilletia caries]
AERRPGVRAPGIYSGKILSPVFISGNGVLVHVEANRKSGRIIGKVFFTKTTGWLDYTLEVEFEDTLRFNAWLLPPPPPPRTVVNFDAILNCVDEDGTVRAFLRRIVAVEPASSSLLAALKNEKVTVNNRASLILEARSKRVKLTHTPSTVAEPSTDTTLVETPIKEAPSIAIARTLQPRRKRMLLPRTVRHHPRRVQLQPTENNESVRNDGLCPFL